MISCNPLLVPSFLFIASTLLGASGCPSGENQGPSISVPESINLDEQQALSLEIEVSDPENDDVRVYATGLPPGAYWHESEQKLSFTPDFTQGGKSWTVDFLADDGQISVESSVLISVSDTISPPDPSVRSQNDESGYKRLYLDQVTDDFLDSPNYSGRTFEAVLIAPTGASASKQLPVRVMLHGFNGSPNQSGWDGEFRIAPHDPSNSYWWGYNDGLPESADTGLTQEYTARRVLHLLEWVLRTYPGADPERVYVEGASMGGAGAATIGLLHGRHFAWVEATIGQKIPRNHRSSRIEQLSTLWGQPSTNADDGQGMGCWDRMDLTRALADSPEARHQMLFTKHGKDDPTIHFGAVVMDSPLTGLSFYEASERYAPGLYAVWDEGGHGSLDPALGQEWWHSGWNPIFDSTTYARRSLAFPAFTGSQIADWPGDGSGNGKQSWDENSGYAGTVSVAQDTGWNGDIAGGLQRFIRWDSTAIIDELHQFSVPLKVLDSEGGESIGEGYPTTGDKLDGTTPVQVDVTPRRLQKFQMRGGESLNWSFGSLSGQSVANELGEITIPALPLTTNYEVLTIQRP